MTEQIGVAVVGFGWMGRVVGPGQGDFAAFQPAAGTAMGYDDLKVIEAAGFLRAIAIGQPVSPTVADAVRAAATQDAMAESVSTGRWVALPARSS
jgi:predicted dehydrogenase